MIIMCHNVLFYFLWLETDLIIIQLNKDIYHFVRLSSDSVKTDSVLRKVMETGEKSIKGLNYFTTMKNKNSKLQQ